MMPSTGREFDSSARDGQGSRKQKQQYNNDARMSAG